MRELNEREVNLVSGGAPALGGLATLLLLAGAVDIVYCAEKAFVDGYNDARANG
jgi:hypothetical protein